MQDSICCRCEYDVQWTINKPNREGWYFWRKSESDNQPWKWLVFYVKDNRNNVMSKYYPCTFWKSGKRSFPPAKGIWTGPHVSPLDLNPLQCDQPDSNTQQTQSTQTVL